MLNMESYDKSETYNLLEDTDVINNLTSSNTNVPLSANQGRMLNQSIEALEKFFEYNQNQEIDTGLKWIDGRPIYRRFCKIDLSNVSLEGDYDFDFTQCDFVFLDECSCLWTAQSYSVGADFYFYPLNVIGSTKATTVNDVISGAINCFFRRDKINVSLGSGFNTWYNVFYISFLYVKKG